MASNDKAYLLGDLGEGRLRELADRWRVVITDGRLGAPGVAKLLARKRSLSVADVVEALSDGEAHAAVERLEVPLQSGDPRATLNHHLRGSSWRAVRKVHADFTLTDETLLAEVVEVVDGDTLRVRFDGRVELLRLRGVDAPESRPSDKVERDLDQAAQGHDEATEYALGAKATAWLANRIGPGTHVELHVQRRADGSLVKLNGYRLLAFVGVAASSDSDLGLAMIEAGQALVWPRNKKSRRYQHPRLAAYLRSCNAAFQTRPGLWDAGLAHHCPAVRAGADRCDVSDCERTCSPISASIEGASDA